jgi:hypothetical protein
MKSTQQELMPVEAGPLVINQEAEQRLAQSDPMLAFIERAAKDPAFDAAKLRELLEMRRELRKDAAKEAFTAAMADFKRNPPTVLRNVHVKIVPKDTTKAGAEYWHPSLEHACEAITEGLNKVKIWHRWHEAPAIKPGNVRIVCILTHELGYSEETALEAPADPSGGKNPIQAVSSSTSYLQRYTLLMAVGIAAKGVDNDGRGEEESAESVPEETVVMRLDAIGAAGNVDELKTFYMAALEEAKAIGDTHATDAYGKAKNKRWRELHATGVK